MTELPKESEDFDAVAHDLVLVRVREDGKMRAKFVAQVGGFRTTPGPGGDKISLNPPWDSVTGVQFAPYEAEFEVIDHPDEVWGAGDYSNS
mgnify:CR=1 FL=1